MVNDNRKTAWGAGDPTAITTRDGRTAGTPADHVATPAQPYDDVYDNEPWLESQPVPAALTPLSNPFAVDIEPDPLASMFTDEPDTTNEAETATPANGDTHAPDTDTLAAHIRANTPAPVEPADSPEAEHDPTQTTDTAGHSEAGTAPPSHTEPAHSSTPGNATTALSATGDPLADMFTDPAEEPDPPTHTPNTTPPAEPAEPETQAGGELVRHHRPDMSEHTTTVNHLRFDDPALAHAHTMADLFAADVPTSGQPEQPAAHATSAYHDDDTRARIEANRDIIDQIRGLGQSGDTGVQSVIKTFELTSDPDKDARQLDAYRRMLTSKMAEHRIYIPVENDFELVTQTAYDELLGLGPLGPLWRDENIADIIVTGPKKVSAERDGMLIDTNITFDNLHHLQSIARTLSMKVDDRGASRSNPTVTAQLPGARVQIMWEPVAVAGCSVVIRKHRRLLTGEQLLASGALTDDIAALIAESVAARASILVSGSTGSGKTTWLNIASGFIPDSERVIVLEDARELHLANSNVEYLLTKERSTPDDPIVIGLDVLLDAALRMRPDRIIVGEIIKPPGAAAMLEAAYTGHDGTMTTIHANSGNDALMRMGRLLTRGADMPIDMATSQVWDTFDLLLHVERDNLTGARYIAAVAAVTDDHTVNTIYTGHSPRDGHRNATFTYTGPLRADTSLARRLHETGVDISYWERTP